MIVRREGDQVLFLNDLRHQPNAAMKLRIPLTETDVPAVMAVLGKRGLVMGADYRGVKVVSVLMPIPDINWFMVTKIDADEAFSAWRDRSYLLIGFFAGLVILISIVGVAVWFRRQKEYYWTLYRSENALRASIQRHTITLRAIGDGVIATDSQGKVELLNPVAEELTGWSEPEAQGKQLTEIFQIVNEDSRQKVEDPVAKVLRDGVVVGLANHTLLISRDGSERPIADSGAPIFSDNRQITGVVLVFRDQTEERAAQQAIAESEERFRGIFDNASLGIYRTASDGQVLLANEALLQTLGYENVEEMSLQNQDRLVSYVLN